MEHQKRFRCIASEIITGIELDGYSIGIPVYDFIKILS